MSKYFGINDEDGDGVISFQLTSDDRDVTITLDESSTVWEVAREFAYFLRALGYADDMIREVIPDWVEDKSWGVGDYTDDEQDTSSGYIVEQSEPESEQQGHSGHADYSVTTADDYTTITLPIKDARILRAVAGATLKHPDTGVYIQHRPYESASDTTPNRVFNDDELTDALHDFYFNTEDIVNRR